MSEGEHADIVRSAREAVTAGGLDLETEAGVEALKVLLSHLLSTAHSPAQEPASTSSGAADVSPGDRPEQRLARWAAIDVSRVLDAFTFGDVGAQVELSTRNLPSTKAARQRLLALLKLTVDRIAYEREAVPSRELTQLCDRYNAMDRNFSVNLQQDGYDELISRRGRAGSHTYRLTQYGLDEGRELIRGLLGAT